MTDDKVNQWQVYKTGIIISILFASLMGVIVFWLAIPFKPTLAVEQGWQDNMYSGLCSCEKIEERIVGITVNHNSNMTLEEALTVCCHQTTTTLNDDEITPTTTPPILTSIEMLEAKCRENESSMYECHYFAGDRTCYCRLKDDYLPTISGAAIGVEAKAHPKKEDSGLTAWGRSYFMDDTKLNDLHCLVNKTSCINNACRTITVDDCTEVGG